MLLLSMFLYIIGLYYSNNVNLSYVHTLKKKKRLGVHDISVDSIIVSEGALVKASSLHAEEQLIPTQPY